jgi:superfamily II DNA or RNA helicase
LKIRLAKDGIDSVVYHSKSKGKDLLLDKFRKNEVRVLLTARALDEGFDVPDCDMAIIMAGYKGERQVKQRLGRILRKKDKTAIIYLLYADRTKDEDWLAEMRRYIG